MRSYLEVLGVPQGLLASWVGAASDGAGTAEEAFQRLEEIMACQQTGDGSRAADRAGDAARYRVHTWMGGGATGASVDIAERPPLVRCSMASERWRSTAGSRPSIPWRGVLLAVLVLVPSYVASQFLLGVLPHPGLGGLNDSLAVVFGLLFGWISIGLWISLAGALSLLLWRRPGLRGEQDVASQDIPRTAVVMPVFHEDPVRVCAGIEAVHRSLDGTGRAAHFDFFILSDSDNADAWVEEERAWAALRFRLGPAAKVFYRRRRSNIKRKSGNIADFCRRFGGHYRYMVVLDADSLMSGSALTQLVATMEANPAVGLIQTLPAAVHQHTLFGRIQQFGNRLYGPVFAAGLHFWHMGEGHYWGHNAIIRIAPFIRHCALPRLPGKGALGGEIMSHDFVEAALLRRAGWRVLLEPGLEGSYEEIPPTLLDELKRDRRWAQGNLQHMRLIFARGIALPHRIVFLNGIMSYVSSLLWLAFLVLSSIEVVLNRVVTPRYFPKPHMLFPDWPVWHPHWALILFWFTMSILFVPKMLALLLAVVHRRMRLFGGFGPLVVSVTLEGLVSALLAPVRMLFHTMFVVLILAGRKIGWGPQVRGDGGTSWRQSLRHHAAGTVLAAVWGGAVYLLSPGYFWWLTPIIASWLLAIPMSVWLSRTRPGLAARRLGLFMTPEEVNRPPLLEFCEQARARPLVRRCTPTHGFLAAVVDPGVNALHCMLLGVQGTPGESVALHRRLIMTRALRSGPEALGARDRLHLLSDRRTLAALHRCIWALQGAAARRWLHDVRGDGKDTPIQTLFSTASRSAWPRSGDEPHGPAMEGQY
ncbi:MAG: glucans biosynthesis glucosyltransferase MdoH [Acidiferrobacterales bacterium]